MQPYKMASPQRKEPLKIIEVPLNKFKEEVIPFHQQLFDKNKTNIHKLINLSNIPQLQKEAKDIKKYIKQLRDLMYELDTLRTQVENVDLDKFDGITLSLRKIILNLISQYGDLEKLIIKTIGTTTQHDPGERNKENLNPFAGAPKIQVQANIDDLKLEEAQNRLKQVENINQDVQDLHEMYQDLHEMVGEQGENVDKIEESVENAAVNVEEGAKSLVKAHKMKAAAYPITGALLGTIIGGPVGLVAGLKIGGLAALSCAVAGYSGGKFFEKKHHDADQIERETVCNENTENEQSQNGKKQI